MKINFKEKVTKDTFYTFQPLNWLLMVFNLSSVYRKDNKLVLSWSFIKSFIIIVVFGSFNFFCLIHKVNRQEGVRKNTILKFSDSIELTYLLGYLMHVFDIYLVYRYGREKFLKYYEVFDSIDKILGMKNYDEIRKLIFIIVGVSTIIFFLSSFFDLFAWIEADGGIIPFLYSLDYFYFYLNMLTTFDSIAHVVQLEYRLRMMKNLLKDYYNSNSIKTDDNQILAIKPVKDINRLECLQSLSHSYFIEAIEFNRCYLMLLEQTKYINKFFGFRIVVFFINALINIIVLINIAIRLVAGSMTTPLCSVYLPAGSSICRFLNWAYMIIILAYRTEMTYRENEEVLEMIDLILHDINNSNKFKVTLTELRNLIVTRPIKYHAAYFFNIDCTILVSMSSVVVTYTIIMLQSMQ